MSEESFAISKISPTPPAQDDYDSICAALMQTGRGRWFLQEYAKRNRSADTRLLLAAIERIEAVVCAERNKPVQHGFRSDLLEMAKAITRTRAEVAEIRSDAVSPAPPPSQPRDVFAAAERIRDVTWAMRGHGFDPSTCDQLEELAASILSASSLRDPTDHRASKLSEVLRYLEHRIDALLESSADGDASGREPVTEPDRDAFEPVTAPGSDLPASDAELSPSPADNAAPGVVDSVEPTAAFADPVRSQVEAATHAKPAEGPTAPLPAAAVPAQPTSAPMPQPPAGDPLAALRAMSGHELIALFS